MRTTIPIVPAARADLDHLLAPPLRFDARTAKIAAQYSRTQESFAPISVQVSLTDRCFNRCVMCGHPDRPVMDTVDVSRWLSMLNKLRERGTESVCYSGGDPMAYPEFNRVMLRHIEYEMAFGATITGFIPPSIDIALLARAAWVRVSLDAITPEIYAVVRGKVKVEKVVDGIDTLLAAGANVGLGITVHSQNAADLPNVLAFAAARGITDIDVRHAYPDSLPAQPAQIRHVQQFTRCHATLFQLYFEADGGVYPCCITAGDTRDAPVKEALLGNYLTDDWHAIWSRAVAYSRVPIDQLPLICRTCCVQRLSEINHVCDRVEQTTKKPLFF